MALETRLPQWSDLSLRERALVTLVKNLRRELESKANYLLGADGMFMLARGQWGEGRVGIWRAVLRQAKLWLYPPVLEGALTNGEIDSVAGFVWKEATKGHRDKTKTLETEPFDGRVTDELAAALQLPVAVMAGNLVYLGEPERLVGQVEKTRIGHLILDFPVDWTGQMGGNQRQMLDEFRMAVEGKWNVNWLNSGLAVVVRKQAPEN